MRIGQHALTFSPRSDAYSRTEGFFHSFDQRGQASPPRPKKSSTITPNDFPRILSKMAPGQCPAHIRASSRPFLRAHSLFKRVARRAPYFLACNGASWESIDCVILMSRLKNRRNRGWQTASFPPVFISLCSFRFPLFFPLTE